VGRAPVGTPSGPPIQLRACARRATQRLPSDPPRGHVPGIEDGTACGALLGRVDGAAHGELRGRGSHGGGPRVSGSFFKRRGRSRRSHEALFGCTV